jgi:hypothetical protein
MDEGRLFGRGVAFPPHIGADGRWAWSQGSENIREAIRIILLTNPGERILLNSFGGGLATFLFEPNTTATRRLMQERVKTALRLWEPRITVQSVRVDADPASEQRALVTIEYQLVATQTTEAVTLTVNLGA